MPILDIDVFTPLQHQAALNANRRTEQAEVIISNLLSLARPDADGFTIAHDDVIVSLECALSLLQ